MNKEDARQFAFKVFFFRFITAFVLTGFTLLLLPNDSRGLLLSVFTLIAYAGYLFYLIAVLRIELRQAALKGLLEKESELLDLLLVLGDLTTDEAKDRIRNSMEYKVLRTEIKSKWARGELQPFTVNLLDSL